MAQEIWASGVTGLRINGGCVEIDLRTGTEVLAIRCSRNTLINGMALAKRALAEVDQGKVVRLGHT